MKVDPRPLKQAEEALGPTEEQDFTFMLVPVALYRVLSEHSRKEGCSVGQVFQRALMQYLLPKTEDDGSTQDDRDVQRPEDAPARAVIVKRKR